MNSISESVWPWLQDAASIAPLGTFVVAVVAGIAIWQKARSDRRAAWWERVRWAIDHSLSTYQQTRDAGTAALRFMAGSKLATREDAQFFDAMGSQILDREAEGLEVLGSSPEAIVDVGIEAGDNDSEEGGGSHGRNQG